MNVSWLEAEVVTTDKIEHSALMISLFKLAAGNTFI